MLDGEPRIMGDILRETDSQSMTEFEIENRVEVSDGEKRVSDGEKRVKLERKRGKRRSVACKRCHMLKVKCVPSFQDEPWKACLRCLNANKVCEFDPYQSRRRRRRPDRGAENSQEPQKTQKSEMGDVANLKAQVSGLQEHILRLQEENASLIQQKHSSDGSYEQESSSNSSPLDYIQMAEFEKELCLLLEGNTHVTVTLADELKKISEAMKEAARRRQKTDLIEESFLSWDEAKERLELYRNGLHKNFPFVEIPDIDAEEFHKRYRHLFNTIMAVTNFLYGKNNVKDAALLDVVSTENIAYEVIVLGNKSVELLKCLILASLWYNNPLILKKNKRAHIFSFLAVHMLHEVGFIGRSSVNEEDPDVPNKTPNHESMRLTMVVLLSHASISIVLRRTMTIKWTPFVEECCSCLEKSTDPKDRTIALYSRIIQVLEKIHNTVRAPIPERSYTEYIVGELYRKLNHIKAKIPKKNHVLLGYYYSIESYLLAPSFESHEKGNEDDVVQESQLKVPTFKSLEACTRSCANCLAEYASLTVEELTALPTSHSLGIYYCMTTILRAKSLVLSSPTYLNRNIIPIKAMTSIRQILRQMLYGTILYNYNFTLRKNSFILFLCCKSYTMHAQDLMRKSAKDSSLTKTIRLSKRDLTEIENLNKVWDNDVSSGLLTTESGEHYSSPFSLDVTSFPFSRIRTNLGKETDQSRPLFNPVIPSRGSKDGADPQVYNDMSMRDKAPLPTQDNPSSSAILRSVHHDVEMPEAASQQNPEAASQQNPEATSQQNPEAASQQNPEATSQQNPEYPTIQNYLQDIFSLSPNDGNNFFNKGGFIYDQLNEADNAEEYMSDLRSNYFFDLL